jgi:3',5'-cyclic-AMP phosphodiesterase
MKHAIVQLSDLQIGGTHFKQEIFDTIVYEVKNKLKLDAIIVTGDLIDEEVVSQFRQASIEIDKLTDVCPKVVILPGNHDYRHTGYLPFKKFLQYSGF